MQSLRWIGLGGALVFGVTVAGCAADANGGGDEAAAGSDEAALAGKYSIGGTVSGLAGTGLTLSDGHDTITIASSGAFKFPTLLRRGTTYSVVVKTQPSSPSQTCVVANGSGTVRSSNVTNVTVTCATNGYTIGGTVTNLAGSGLAITNNGGDAIALAANGTFTFPTTLASGTTYSVQVKTQPTYPFQTCFVTNGTGVVGSANVTNVGVTCRTNTYAIDVGLTMYAPQCSSVTLSDGTETMTVSPAQETYTTYSFHEPSGQAYTLSFTGNDWLCRCATSPSGPWGNTTGTFGSGTVVNANASYALYCADLIP